MSTRVELTIYAPRWRCGFHLSATWATIMAVASLWDQINCMPWRPVAAGTGHAWVSSRSKEGAPKVIHSNNLDLYLRVNQTMSRLCKFRVCMAWSVTCCVADIAIIHLVPSKLVPVVSHTKRKIQGFPSTMEESKAN